jgi:hypothetical protein
MRFVLGRAGAVLLAALSLSACAGGSQHVFLADPARDKIESTDAFLPVRQDEIYVYVPPSTAGAQAGAGFGLIGALVGTVIDASVDSARTSKAEAAVKPLREASTDYPFDKTLKDAVATSLSGVSFLGLKNVNVSKQITGDGLDGELNASPAGAILVATADYRLDNDGNVLTVSLTAMLLPHNDALRAIKAPKDKPLARASNAIYHNVFLFTTRLPDGGGDRDANIAAWSADHAAPLRAALDMGTKKVAQLLAADIVRPTNDADPTGSLTFSVPGILGQGYLVSSDADGSVVRYKDGSTAYATRALVQP